MSSKQVGLPVSQSPFLGHRFASRHAGLAICVALCTLASISRAAEPPVTAIAFAPDGRSVAVGSQAGVAIYNWPDLKKQKMFDTQLVNLHDLAFSPNGESLAVAGGIPSEEGLVEVLAWPDGKSMYVCKGHEDSVLAVAWKSDSKFATASLDHDVVVWDANTHTIEQRLKGHSRGVTALCFLTDQSLLVSGSLDQNLRVWNTGSAELVRSMNNHTREIHQIALRPVSTGLPMIASVADDRTVRLWQPTINRMVRFVELTSIPLAVSWVPDGSLVAVATSAGHVLLIDPDTVEIIHDIAALDGWAYSLDVHPTDGSLLVGGRYGQLKRILVPTRGQD
jgi:WD40 repeat protein